MDVLRVRKVNRDRFLGQSSNRVDAKTKPFARQLARWLQRFAEHEMGRVGRLRKQSRDQLAAELAAMFERFNLAQARSSILRVGDAVGEPIPVDVAFPGLLDNIDTLVARIMGTTQDIVAAAAEDAIQEAEDLEISNQDLQRRFRDRVMQGASVTFERAERIARTELARAENVGLMTGYTEAGVQEVEWLAFQSPRFSRRHHEMDGVRARVGERFTLPSGVQVRFPHDPSAPPGETVNCRCTVTPVVQ